MDLDSDPDPQHCYPHRRINAGTTRLQDYGVQEYRLPLLNVMYCVRASSGQSKYSLRNTKEKGVVGKLYISLKLPIQINY